MNPRKPFVNFIKRLKILYILILIIFVVNNIQYMVIQKSSNDYEEVDSEIKENYNTEKDLKENTFKSLPWYFKKGTIRPVPGHVNAIWPEDDPGDRILNQLMYVPLTKPKILKKIFLTKEMEDLYDYEVKPGKQIFEKWECPVSDCIVTKDRREADAVVYLNRIGDVRDSSVPFHQIWIAYALESPFFSGKTVQSNWTGSYRPDSDIVTPYAKWVYYNESIKRIPSKKNYARGKKKKVVMLVSNCNPTNKRMEYALELQRYIDVDILGKCGKNNCPKNRKCLKFLGRTYKFYLAFENSNCRHYITEKLFKNALSNNMLPIVMGSHPDDYAKRAPLNSYIHVENFTSPKDLAKYLYLLDIDDDLYNSYFEWKGTGEFIELRFFCRLCALLHSERANRTCYNFENWWNRTGICTKKSWNNDREF